MIARQRLDQERPRIRNPRTARAAADMRISRNARARYTSFVRVCIALGVVLVALMGYVNLTSNVTSLTYSLENAKRDRDALEEQTARLDERLAQLRSEDRLAAVAAKLGMREPQQPQQFAVVTLMPPLAVKAPSPILASLVSWFGAPSHRVNAP